MKTKITKIQGLILDFNGVLLWDTHPHEQVWGEVSTMLRGTSPTPAEMENMVHSRPNKSTFEYLLGAPITSTSKLRDLSDFKEAKYRELCLSNRYDFTLSPGAIDLLEFLEKYKIPHTIATASEKPNPDTYLKAADNINIAPEHCIVVEDAISGIKAAQRANISRIYALGPSERHEILRKIDGVYNIILSLKQFPKNIFEKSNSSPKQQ